ncbi:MAG: nitrilase-related carbon-nitrogen hydrolase, partial [Planctomycetota bacterium]
MKQTLHRYRLVGAAGGLLLAAGQFYGPLCILQLVALVPLMVLVLRDRKVTWAAMSGFYMGIAYTLPQMAYLLMPIPVTVVLLLYMTILLVGLSTAIGYILPRHPVLGPVAIGAAWYILDVVNYSTIPIWGMAQSFGRSWTAYPFAIGFISLTSISGVLFVIGTLQGLIAYGICDHSRRQRSLVAVGVLLAIVFGINTLAWIEQPVGTLRIAAAGWVFDDRSSEIDPNKSAGFKKLFAAPAQEAAAQGARIFTTGEMGFYIANHERKERIQEFQTVAKENNLWLLVGYFNITDDVNRIFFMSPDGEIIHEYTKTYLTPYEPGKKGTGDLQTVEVDGYTIGAMICQDDNFSQLTRYYGRLKADVVLCPTADWWTIKTAHLQAVRGR